MSIKIADTGTSEFWASRSKILKRENALILETAERLFFDQGLDTLWAHPRKFAYRDTLRSLDVLCEYIDQVNCWVDWDRRSENAGKLVSLLLKAPLFNLEQVVAQIRQTGYTTRNRLASRLNHALKNPGPAPRDPWSTRLDPNDEITDDTLESYSCLKEEFIATTTGR